MRKIIGLALLSALVLGFSGCESKEDKEIREQIQKEGLSISVNEYKKIQEKEKEEDIKVIKNLQEIVKEKKNFLAEAEPKLQNPSINGADRYHLENDIKNAKSSITRFEKQIEVMKQKYNLE